jgi:3-oxoacyl-(acyl-carrier-protein) synthase
MTAPHPDGLGVVEAASAALVETDRCGIGWIKSHGTGTKPNDAAECRGLAAVFGSQLPDFPLTSFKPVLGHCLGASGAVETVATGLALETGLIPPTLGTEEVDPALPACTVVTEPTPWNADWVLLLAESFGGRCAALVLHRPPGRILRRATSALA